MKNLKQKAISTKDHIVRNRGRYGFAAGLTTGLALVVRNQSIINEFLEEKGLYDEFYAMDQ